MRLLDRLRGQLNARQEKALVRVLREGPHGFVGGLSASKYMAPTDAPAATGTISSLWRSDSQCACNRSGAGQCLGGNAT
jgi:hypothetical protein